MSETLAGLFLFLFFSTHAFDIRHTRKEAYLECTMNSTERTIVINGQIIQCSCGKFATSAKFELVQVVGYCDQHMPKLVEEKPVEKKDEFPKPPEPILKQESER